MPDFSTLFCIGLWASEADSGIHVPDVMIVSSHDHSSDETLLTDLHAPSRMWLCRGNAKGRQKGGLQSLSLVPRSPDYAGGKRNWLSLQMRMKSYMAGRAIARQSSDAGTTTSLDFCRCVVHHLSEARLKVNRQPVETAQADLLGLRPSVVIAVWESSCVPTFDRSETSLAVI